MPCCPQGLPAKQLTSDVSNGAWMRTVGVTATDGRATVNGKATGDGKAIGDGRTSGGGMTTGDGRAIGDGMATGDGNSGGGVGSKMCLMHIAQLHIVSSWRGTSYRREVKIGSSAGTIMTAIGRRGRTDCLLLGLPTTVDDDIVGGAWRSLAKSARSTSAATGTGDLTCRLVETLTRSMSLDKNVEDGMLKNFSAILRFLIGAGGVNKLKQTSRYKLQLVHSHSIKHDDHMVKIIDGDETTS